MYHLNILNDTFMWNKLLLILELFCNMGNQGSNLYILVGSTYFWCIYYGCFVVAAKKKKYLNDNCL